MPYDQYYYSDERSEDSHDSHHHQKGHDRNKKVVEGKHGDKHGKHTSKKGREPKWSDWYPVSSTVQQRDRQWPNGAMQHETRETWVEPAPTESTPVSASWSTERGTAYDAMDLTDTLRTSMTEVFRADEAAPSSSAYLSSYDDRSNTFYPAAAAGSPAYTAPYVYQINLGPLAEVYGNEDGNHLLPQMVKDSTKKKSKNSGPHFDWVYDTKPRKKAHHSKQKVYVDREAAASWADEVVQGQSYPHHVHGY